MDMSGSGSLHMTLPMLSVPVGTAAHLLRLTQPCVHTVSCCLCDGLPKLYYTHSYRGTSGIPGIREYTREWSLLVKLGGITVIWQKAEEKDGPISSWLQLQMELRRSLLRHLDGFCTFQLLS